MPSPDELSTEELERLLAERRAAAEQPARPPRQPQDHKAVSTAKSWKSKSADTELELPSGEVCRVKRPGITKLLSAGVMPDVLTPLIQQAITAAESGIPGEVKSLDSEKLREVMSAPGGLDAIMDASDRVAAHCVIEPELRYHKVKAGEVDWGWGDPEAWVEIPEERRDPEILYTDEVDIDDKVFIFQFVVGGTRDLEEFRRQAR